VRRHPEQRQELQQEINLPTIAKQQREPLQTIIVQPEQLATNKVAQ
jgi:hypothetical protein